MKRIILFALLWSLLQAGRAQISVIGTSTPAGDWNTDYDMVQDAGNPSVFRLNIYLATGELKFREGYAWTTNWGNTNFPSGTAILDGPNIPVTAGFYTITFDTTTLAYVFSSGNVGINNQDPAVSMDIAGALAHRSAHLDVTSMEVTLPPNVSLVKLTGSPPGSVVLTSSGGADGQRVVLHNATTTAQPVTAFPGAHVIEANETREFTYVAGEGWQPLSAGLAGNNDFWVKDGANDAIRNINANGFYSSHPTLVNADPGILPLPLEGAGTRLLWVPEKSAFRVGTVLGARWDSDSIGTWSFASGYDTRASGIFSTALGTESTALGISSTAMGYSTIASGENAMALNSETLASGDNAVALGNFTVASAVNSIAMGSETTASGISSTSTGYLTTASGENAMAMNSGTSAIGSNSTAMGFASKAIGWESVAMGGATIAKSYGSVAMGIYNDTIAGSSPSTWVPTDPLLTIGNGFSPTNRANAVTVLKNGKMGIKNANPAVSLDITGALAHRTTDLDVTGMEVALPANVSLVRLTGSPPGSAFIDGPVAANGQRVVLHNATSSGQPATAFDAANIIEPGETREFTYVAGEGWQPLSAGLAANNNFWVQDGATDAIRNTNSNGFYSKHPTTVTGNPGALPLPVGGAGTRLMWIPEKSSFRAGTVLGTRWDADSIGTQSIAMGLNPLASGYAAIALGTNVKATGPWATTLGSYTIASGDNSTALGYYTVASGLYATALGASNTASGDFSTAFGNSTLASGDFSTALGYGSFASGLYSTAMGYSTAASGDLSTAWGSSTTSSGSISTAFGNLTTASGYASTALGASTLAFGDYSTALGFGTVAGSAFSVAFGRYNDDIAGSSPVSWVTTDPLLTIGNGNSASSRSNAFVVYKNGDTDIMGFSRFGKTSENAPAIKMKKLTGTGPVTDGTKAIVHGLDAAKILSVSVLMEYGLGPGETIPPKYTTSAGYEYEYQVRTNDIFLLNKAGNSANINERAVRILITYEE